jgi:UDP-3-O-[3-hydroxymyristoyl] glucosamine N-acyltransferase
MRASEIAELVAGTRSGGADPEIAGVAPLDRAEPTDLSFLAHPRYLPYVASTKAGAILVTEELGSSCDDAITRITVPDVHGALAAILPVIYPDPPVRPGVHPTAVLGPGTRLGEAVTVGPYAVIGGGSLIGDRVRIGAHTVIGDGCVVGDDVILYPHVSLYPRVRVGHRSILHTGVRAGVDGFGYALVDGEHRKVPQVGGCMIGNDVEIGANTTIDRGSVGNTEIGDGVKIDNLVHIAHNVRIGEKSIIVAQVGIAGSTTIGRYVTLAGQAGIPGHLHIGDRATIAAQAGVFGDVPAGETYSGYPARPHREALRMHAGLARLPELKKRIRRIERTMEGEAEGE